MSLSVTDLSARKLVFDSSALVVAFKSQILVCLEFFYFPLYYTGCFFLFLVSLQ